MARVKVIDQMWSIVLFPLKVLSWLIIAAFFSAGIFMILTVGLGFLGYMLGIPWLLVPPAGMWNLTSIAELFVATLLGSWLSFRLVRYFS